MTDENPKRALHAAPKTSAPSLDAVLAFRRRPERMRPVPVIAMVVAIAAFAATLYFAAPQREAPVSYAIALPTYTDALDPPPYDRPAQFTTALAAPLDGPLVTWTSNLIPRTDNGDNS